MQIDWTTLALQAVNIAILIWLLGRFFWRPVSEMIAQRQTLAGQNLAAAEAKRTEAELALADIARTRDGFAQERTAILDAAQKEATGLQDAKRQETRTQVETMLAQFQAEQETSSAAAEAEWDSNARDLAVSIAGRLAARLNGPAVQDAFLSWLITAIQALPDATRATVAAGETALDVVSAAALSSEAEAEVARQITTAFGGKVRLNFRVDASLIAGLELSAPHLVLRNSWQADLAQIAAGLTHAA